MTVDFGVGEVVSFSDAAAALGVRPGTIGDLVRVMGIEPKPSADGRVKGLDRADFNRIRRALGVKNKKGES